MACDFCRVTPVDPCPVCGPVPHAGNTRIRKLPKALRNAIANAAPKPRPVPHVMDAQGFRPVGAPVPGANSRAKYTPPPSPVRLNSPEPSPEDRAKIERLKAKMAGNVDRAFPVGTANRAAMIEANERRIRELEAKLRANPTPTAPLSIPPTRANPTPPPPIVRQRPAQAPRVAVLTRPTLADDLREAERMVRGLLWPKMLPRTVTVEARKVDDEATHPPITRGDFRGLWVAVESGLLSEADAIEIAASWREAVATHEEGEPT